MPQGIPETQKPEIPEQQEFEVQTGSEKSPKSDKDQPTISLTPTQAPELQSVIPLAPPAGLIRHLRRQNHHLHQEILRLKLDLALKKQELDNTRQELAKALVANKRPK